MSSMNKITNSLATAVRCNPCLKESVKACDCPFHAKHRNFEKMLNGRPEDLLKLTLCQRIEQPDLKCRCDIPKLYHPNCVIKPCTNCTSILPIFDCKIYSEHAEKFKSILWQEAEMAGAKTQLEPVENHLPFNETSKHLVTCVEDSRKIYVLGQWSDHMIKIDSHESDQNATIMLTDFSASLDLHARQTDNC